MLAVRLGPTHSLFLYQKNLRYLTNGNHVSFLRQINFQRMQSLANELKNDNLMFHLLCILFLYTMRITNKNINNLPKSASFNSPFLLISKFWGFKSLWRTLWLWQNASPRSNCSIKLLQTAISISPLRLSKYFLRSWSQCSNTSVSFLSECKTSYRRTIFLCLSSYKKER